MKRHIRQLSTIATLLVLSVPVITMAQDAKRQRLINKSYDVSADDKLTIDNQFGNVVVSTWDKQQITVDVEISAKATTDEKAQDIMNKIDVHDSRDGHEIKFKTNVDEIHNANGNKGRHNDENVRSFYIDYIVHMPASNRLSIENSFGKTEVPAMKGLVSLTSKFGSLNTGKLDNVDQIDVEFGKAYITSLNNGKIALKFDKETRIGRVDGNVKISCEFSQRVQFHVGDIQELSLFESYSGVRVVVDKNLSAEFAVHTSFGHFNNESDFDISEHKDDAPDYGPHFDKDYSGKAGDGKARIKIKSSFGNVVLSNNGGGKDEDEGMDKDDRATDQSAEEQ